MRKYILYFIILTAVFASCQSEIESCNGEGYIQLSGVEINKNVNTRATTKATEQIAVRISQGEKIFKEADDWTTLQGESFLVPAGGTYKVEAYSFGKDLETQGFDAQPFYRGEKSLVVEAGKSHTINVTCLLAQSIVKVSYSEKFKKKFSEYTAILKGNNGLEIAFATDETREAYVKSGQTLNIVLNLDSDKGSVQTINTTIAENAKPAYRYNVNFDLENDGNGGTNISVTVDQTVNQYDVTLVVPNKPEKISTTDISKDVAKVWGKFAILAGECSLQEPSSPIEFKYKKTTDATWLTVPAQASDIPQEYTAKITSLEFGTEYQYKMVCGVQEGEVCTFTTETYEEIPNLNFDTWTQNKKNWFANADAADSYWASGNSGVTAPVAGSNDPITVKSNDAVSGAAAEMHTITGISLVGAAAGNLFIGEYKTNIFTPSASVKFGRPYNGARPTKLRGYYKYSPSNISYGSYPGNLTTDECNIYIKLWAADGSEIAFGEFVGKENITEYTPFEFDIIYTDQTKRPAKLTIVATSSHYGGHFEGSKITGQLGAGSTLWVDEFTLSYE